MSSCEQVAARVGMMARRRKVEGAGEEEEEEQTAMIWGGKLPDVLVHRPLSHLASL